MGSQIIFFNKNAADFSNPNVVASASEGTAYAIYAINRTNLSAWMTTGSIDANLTTWTVDFVDKRLVTDILLLKHNFKSFTVKYWDGAAYQDFSPAINETTNAAASSAYQVAQVSTSKLQITINGTIVANADKFLYQFIATTRIGKLNGWPVIKAPSISRNRRTSKMLSGKLSVGENVGGYSSELDVNEWRDSSDLTVVETLYSATRGFLMWPCGGNEAQFSSVRQGYRMEDIFLVRCINEYAPEYVQGMYTRGLVLKIKIAEVVD